MLNTKDFNFSFSGLKTAVLYAAQKISKKDLSVRTPEICYEFQEAAIDVLVGKAIKATRQYQTKTIIMAGGVAANKKLRESLKVAAEKSGLEFWVPEFKLCTDNAAMIGMAAYYLLQKKKVSLDNYENVAADPNWELD